MRAIVILNMLLVFCLALAVPADAKTIDGTRSYTLRNGMRVVLVPASTPGLIHLQMTVGAGRHDDPAGRPETAHVVEHLMDPRDPQSDKLSFGVYRELAGPDADRNAFTEEAITTYYATVRSDTLDTALWIERRRIANTAQELTVADVEREKGVVENELRERTDNKPYVHDGDRLSKMLYPPGCVARRPFVVESSLVQRLTLDDVRTFVNKWYVPSNMTLVVAGDIPNDVEQKIETWLGDLPYIDLPHHSTCVGPDTIDGLRSAVAYDAYAVHPRVYYVWVGPKPYTDEAAELELLGNMLTFSAGSLERRLVQAGLAHDVSTDLRERNGTTRFTITVDVVPRGDVSRVKGIVEEELVRVAVEPPDPERLRMVQLWAEISVAGRESLKTIAYLARKHLDAYGKAGQDAQDLAHATHATPESLMHTARAYLRLEQAVQLVTLPGVDERPSATEEHYYTVVKPNTRGPYKPRVTAAFLERPTKIDAQAITASNIETAAWHGLKVVLYKKPGALVSLGLAMPGGEITDAPGLEGTARLCAAFAGISSRYRTKNDFYEQAEKLGVLVEADADEDTTLIHIHGIRRSLLATLRLVGEALSEPHVDSDDLAREGREQTKNVRVSATRLDGRVDRYKGCIFYGADHRFARVTTEQSLARISPRTCDAYLATYLRPAGSTLIAVGDISMEDLLDMLREAWSTWSGSALYTPIPKVHPSQPAFYLADLPGAKQSTIAIGVPGPSVEWDDYQPTRLAVAITGGDFSSRVNSVLRGSGISYHASAHLNVFRGGGTVRVETQVDRDATGSALESLCRVLRDVSTAGVTEDEFRSMRDGQIAGAALPYETGESTLRELLSLVYLQRPLDWMVRFAEELKRLSIQEVNVAAKRYLDPRGMNVLVVGDIAAIRPQIEELRKGGCFPHKSIVELSEVEAN